MNKLLLQIHVGQREYLNAVEEAFGADIDYAVLVKQYGEPQCLRWRCHNPD